jgi:sugar-specific transcriptional regulator TrmB
MNVRQFLTFAESYYGEKYDGVVLDVMQGYLENRSSEFLEAAANVLTRRFSRTYKKAPGPAEIEDNLDEIYETMKKPVCLPEAREEISDEERQKVGAMLHELTESFKAGKRPGPLSGPLSDAMGNIGKTGREISGIVRGNSRNYPGTITRVL